MISKFFLVCLTLFSFVSLFPQGPLAQEIARIRNRAFEIDLSADELKDDTEKIVSTLSLHAAHVSSIINSLLSFAKSGCGSEDIERLKYEIGAAQEGLGVFLNGRVLRIGSFKQKVEEYLKKTTPTEFQKKLDTLNKRRDDWFAFCIVIYAFKKCGIDWCEGVREKINELPPNDCDETDIFDFLDLELDLVMSQRHLQGEEELAGLYFIDAKERLEKLSKKPENILAEVEVKLIERFKSQIDELGVGRDKGSTCGAC
jgi:hypothetical protein